VPRYRDAIADSLVSALLRWQQDRDSWFEVDLELPYGVVQLAAELVLDPQSGTLALFDVAIYPLDDMIYPVGSSTVAFLEAMRDLRYLARQYGYAHVQIMGERVSNSLSARPGHKICVRL